MKSSELTMKCLLQEWFSCGDEKFVRFSLVRGGRLMYDYRAFVGPFDG